MHAVFTIEVLIVHTCKVLDCVSSCATKTRPSFDRYIACQNPGSCRTLKFAEHEYYDAYKTVDTCPVTYHMLKELMKEDETRGFERLTRRAYASPAKCNPLCG